LTTVFAVVLRAQGNAQLRDTASALYESADNALAAKDLHGYISLFTSDYEQILIGKNRDGIRELIKDIFDGYNTMRASHTLLSVTRAGKWIKAIVDVKIEGRTRRNEWEIVTQETRIDLLTREGGALRFARSTPTDKFRLANVSGQTYTDNQAGLSFSVPAGWLILPYQIQPNMQGQGNVLVLAPDGVSAALFLYVKSSSPIAKRAVESDESFAKLISSPDVYKLIKSETVRIHGLEGYEIESEFSMPLQDARTRRRRRVYLDADGLMYAFCFDAIPSTRWDAVKDGFQSILDSMSFIK